MSDLVEGSAEWIKAEQAKVLSGRGASAGSGFGRWALIGCGIPAAIILGLVVIVVVWPKDHSPRVGGAIVACENAVETMLKSPSTARFNSAASGDNPWTIVGSVDSENSFGATVRADYQCTVSGTRATVNFLE